ncbi:MAG TPA: trimethylamine methyltransferase family protein, partial [Acidimicrobiales bacterium]|nr:trimethylamine methyltransferase family protein [Acidimicrobiales bacterium]
MSSVETGGRGERRGRRPARAVGEIAQLPWKQPRNRLPPVALVSADELESIHDASLQILEQIGMDVLLPEAREIYRAAGATVDGQRVRADRDLVLEAVARAPERYRMHARNPAHDLEELLPPGVNRRLAR